MKKIIYIIILLCWGTISISQQPLPYFGSPDLINGYAKSIEGEVIPYFSVYPKYAKDALLTRCTDGKKTISWETEPIPQNTQGPYAYFTWIAAHSTGTSSGERYFDLYINDTFYLTFSTLPNNYPPFWSFTGKDSTRLLFEFKTRDGANDAHGMAYLRVPVSKFPKGKALRLKVIGHNQNSNDWYMTFQYSFKEKMEINPLPFLLKGEGTPKQPIRITVLHFGKKEKLTLIIGGQKQPVLEVQNGFSVFDIPVKAVKNNQQLEIEGAIGKMYKMKTTILQKPVKYREIDLIHHAHTDIGYSHTQEEVIQIHNRNIRRALQLIDKSKNYPEGSRFIWNIESSWAVENFLSEATIDEKKVFSEAVNNKQIAISATFANVSTGLCTPEEMHWIMAYSNELRSKFGFPINTAMMSDIPGMSGSMIPALAQNGIRYFSNGPNYINSMPDQGDRIGQTLNVHGDKPFWWKSTSGKDSILFWTAGKGYSSWHGFAQGSVNERGTEKIAEYMTELDTSGYPYEMVQWRYNIVSDNGPTDSTICDFVKQWNEQYSSPKLVIANVSEMFTRFERRYGQQIPVLTGDFTPYWEDGAYSTAKEEGDARVLSEQILLLENYARQKHISLDSNLLYQAKREIVLFHEHTWGSWNSISDPDAPFTKHQWEYKKSYLDSAIVFINSLKNSILIPTQNPEFIQVTNTLAWKRDGLVALEGLEKMNCQALISSEGDTIPVQMSDDGKMYFVAKNIPPNGDKQYRIITEHNRSLARSGNSTSDQELAALQGGYTIGLEKSTNMDDSLQILYVGGLDPNQFSKCHFYNKKIIANGPVFKRWQLLGNLDGTNGIVYEITHFKELNYTQLTIIIDKKPVREKESMHIKFPFNLKGKPSVNIGMDNGFYSPENGQISGSNKDYFCVQRWIDVTDETEGTTLVSPQAALFEIGEMVDERKTNNGYKTWKTQGYSSSTIFLYALNNYWHTNFKADQEGKMRFDIYLVSHNLFDPNMANYFGYEITQPLVAEPK